MQEQEYAQRDLPCAARLLEIMARSDRCMGTHIFND